MLRKHESKTLRTTVTGLEPLSSEDRRNTYYSSDTVRKNKFDTTTNVLIEKNFDREEQHKQCVDREEHKQKLNVENK